MYHAMLIEHKSMICLRPRHTNVTCPHCIYFHWLYCMSLPCMQKILQTALHFFK